MSMVSDQPSLHRDLLYYAPAKLIPAVLTFAIVILLTRSLAPEEYGAYAAFIAIIRLIDVMSFAWLRQSMLRYNPSYQEKGTRDWFQSQTISFLLIIGALELVVASALMVVLDYQPWLIAVMLLTLVLLTFFNYFVTIFQSERHSKAYAFVTLLRSGVQTLFVFGFVYFAKQGYVFALIALAASYLVGIIFVILYRSKIKLNLKPNIEFKDLSLFKKLIAYGLPIAIWLLSFQLLFQANRLIIRELRSEAEVGVYASSYDLINGSLSLLMTPFLLAAHPIIMHLWEKSHNRVEVEELIGKVSRYLFLLCIPILIFSLTEYSWLSMVLGPGYGVIRWVVPVLVLSSFLAQYAMYAHKGLEIAGKTRTMMIVGLITAFLNITLNLLLVGRYGYAASAVIAAVSYLFYIIVVYQYSRRHISLIISGKSTARIVIACGGAALLLWLLGSVLDSSIAAAPSGLFLYTILFVSSYLVLLIATGEVTSELKLLLKVVQRWRSELIAKNTRKLPHQN